MYALRCIERDNCGWADVVKARPTPPVICPVCFSTALIYTLNHLQKIKNESTRKSTEGE